jgi:hypothetical protein
MSEDLVDPPFKKAAVRVEDAYDDSAEELKTKVELAKAAALKKISQ